MRPAVAIAALAAALLPAAPAAAQVKWGSAQVVERRASALVTPRAAVNRRGEAIVAYRVRAAKGHYGDALEIVRRRRNGRLGRPQRIETDNTYGFDLALADDGRAYAVWWREHLEDDVRYEVLVAEAPPGGRFGAPRILQELYGDWPEGLRVATAAGRAVVAFNGERVIRILTRERGRPFGAVLPGAATLAAPQLAMSEAGEALVTYLGPTDGDPYGPSERALFAVAVRGEQVGEPAELARLGRADLISTGMGAGGGLVAAWQGAWAEQYATDRFYGPIRALAAPAGRPATAPVDLDRSPASERGGAQRPALAVARDGSGVVAWHHVLRPKQVKYPLRGRVHAARLTAGGRAGKPQALSDRRRISTDPRVATDRGGRTAVVWQDAPKESLDRPLRLKAAAASRGRRFGRPRTLVRPAERAETYALAAGGRRFLLVYQRRRGSRGEVVIREGR